MLDRDSCDICIMRREEDSEGLYSIKANRKCINLCKKHLIELYSYIKEEIIDIGKGVD